MKSICVYCGSSSGSSDNIIETASELGKLIASHNYRLVYGGGAVGLMGTLARAALSHNGQVLGIIPTFLHNKEIALTECTELIEVPSMHHRKALMIDESDALVALPGGFGTMDELFEAITWLQLDLHELPIYLINVDGYYDHLVGLIHTMYNVGFISQTTMSLLHVVDSLSDLPFFGME